MRAWTITRIETKGTLLAPIVDGALGERAENLIIMLCLGKCVRLDLLEVVVKRWYQLLPC